LFGLTRRGNQTRSLRLRGERSNYDATYWLTLLNKRAFKDFFTSAKHQWMIN